MDVVVEDEVGVVGQEVVVDFQEVEVEDSQEVVVEVVMVRAEVEGAAMVTGVEEEAVMVTGVVEDAAMVVIEAVIAEVEVVETEEAEVIEEVVVGLVQGVETGPRGVTLSTECGSLFDPRMITTPFLLHLYDISTKLYHIGIPRLGAQGVDERFAS
jgi:hypothetical protein